MKFHQNLFSPCTSSCKVSALCCAGGEQNLILLDRTTHKPSTTGTVGWAGSTFGPLHKSRVGEHEFEALMRTLDNLVRGTAALHFPEGLQARFLPAVWPFLLLARSCFISKLDFEGPVLSCTVLGLQSHIIFPKTVSSAPLNECSVEAILRLEVKEANMRHCVSAELTSSLNTVNFKL